MKKTPDASSAYPAAPDDRLRWQARLPFFYGWVIVAVVFLRSFTIAGSLWVAIGILAVPMHDELGWSRTVIFGGLTLRTLGAAFSAVLFGKYLDVSGGPKVLAVGSGVIATITLLMISQVQEPWQFMLLFGVVGGFLGNGPAILLPGAVVPKWFVRKRGRAGATASMGTGLAGFLLAPILSLIAEALGWRGAWLALGSLVFVLAVFPAFLLQTRPEDVGLRPDGDAAASPGAETRARPSQEVSYTSAEAFRTQTLWLLVAVSIFGSVSTSAFPANLVSVLSEQGFATSTGAAALSGYGLFSFGSRVLWGYLADRIHMRRLLLIIAVYTGLALPMILILPGQSVLISGAFTGAGVGGWVGLNQLLWATYFGRANLGSIIGRVRPFITLSSATGPLLVAFLADASGTYTASILVMALSWWLCSLCLFLVRPPEASGGRRYTSSSEVIPSSTG